MRIAAVTNNVRNYKQNNPQKSNTISFESNLGWNTNHILPSVKTNLETINILEKVVSAAKTKEGAIGENLLNGMNEKLMLLFANKGVSMKELVTKDQDGMKILLATDNNALFNRYHLSVKKEDESVKHYVIDAKTVQRFNSDPKKLNSEVQQYLKLFLSE